MSILFTPIRIGSLTVPNRFARSATHAYLADDEGFVTRREVELYRRLAEGEVGLIITGHAFVRFFSRLASVVWRPASIRIFSPHSRLAISSLIAAVRSAALPSWLNSRACSRRIRSVSSIHLMAAFIF